MENALKHGAPEGEVLVALEADGTLSVVSGGPVVPPDQLAGLMGRFARGKGTGERSWLGLAIVGAISQGANLRMELRSPLLGRADGFEARLLLQGSAVWLLSAWPVMATSIGSTQDP